jgi:hypothetical protein
MMKKFFFGFSVVSFSVAAANWISITDTLHIDKSSVKRSGEVAEVIVAFEGNFVDTRLIFFDCANKKASFAYPPRVVRYEVGSPFADVEKIVF